MPTYRLDLSYDGSGFRGYATQAGLRTIQGELERGLAVLVGPSFETAVAGRTDAGVHARGQVVSVVTAEPIDADTTLRSLNGILGSEIAIHRIETADDDFHARFTAKWRSYRYLLDCGTAADPLSRHIAWHVGPSIDMGRIRTATAPLVGEHDFSSFCRSVEGRSNMRRVHGAHWEDQGQFQIFWIRANSFCHQMVRSLVGHLYDVGRGFSDPDSTRSVIDARDRSAVATVAPPHGLTLWEVGYAEELEGG